MTSYKDQPEKVKDFLKALNSRGQVFITPIIYKGIASIHAALVNWRTTGNDIKLVWDEMGAAYQTVKANW